MSLQMLVHNFLVVQSNESDILVKQVVSHPHGNQKSYVADAINGENLYGIFYRKIAVAVKGDEQERRDTKYFPADEECFEITGKDN